MRISWVAWCVRLIVKRSLAPPFLRRILRGRALDAFVGASVAKRNYRKGMPVAFRDFPQISTSFIKGHTLELWLA